MVLLCPSVATPKTPKMSKSKTPKKDSAVDTPAKPEGKTPKQAKNTPAKAALLTPKMKKEGLVKEETSTPNVAALQTPKMAKSKTPKKSSAVDTPAKPGVKTPNRAKNTPAKAALLTPKMKKEGSGKEETSTPTVASLQTTDMKKILVKEAKNTPKAAAQTTKNGITSAKKNKTKRCKPETPSEDVEMESVGEEEAQPAEPSPKKRAVIKSDYEEIEVNPKSAQSSAPKIWKKFKKVGDEFGLFVRGLNYNSSEKAVSQHFSQFGTVTRCAIPRNAQKKNLNKGFGFLEFTSQAAVDKAVATTHALDGRILEVKVNDTELARKRKSDNSNKPGGDHKRQMTTSDNELRVACLSFSTSKDTIKEHFSQFGEVDSVGLPIKPNTSENKGFAFVAFKEASALQKAMADTNQVIDSAKIVIEPRKKAVVKEAFPKPPHHNELFVGGLDNSTRRHTLVQHFSKYGKVTNVTLPWNKNVGKNTGFGFVSFESAASLENALEDDHEINGLKIDVKAAVSKSADGAVSKKVEAVPATAKVEEEDDENDVEDDENDGEDDENDEEDDESDEEQATEGEEDDE